MTTDEAIATVLQGINKKDASTEVFLGEDEDGFFADVLGCGLVNGNSIADVLQKLANLAKKS